MAMAAAKRDATPALRQWTSKSCMAESSRYPCCLGSAAAAHDDTSGGESGGRRGTFQNMENG
jgi:hypothetical protein